MTPSLPRRPLSPAILQGPVPSKLQPLTNAKARCQGPLSSFPLLCPENPELPHEFFFYLRHASRRENPPPSPLPYPPKRNERKSPTYPRPATWGTSNPQANGARRPIEACPLTWRWEDPPTVLEVPRPRASTTTTRSPPNDHTRPIGEKGKKEGPSKSKASC